MRYAWFVAALVAAAMLAAGCKQSRIEDMSGAPKAPAVENAFDLREADPPTVAGELIIFNEVGEKHMTTRFAADLQKLPSKDGIESVRTTIDPSQMWPDLAKLFQGSGWFPFAGRYAGLKMEGQLYLVRALGQSRKDGGTTEVELALVKKVASGQDTIGSLRNAAPNVTDANTQGIPSAEWGMEREPVGCLEEAAVGLRRLNEFGVVVAKGVDIDLLTTHNQRFPAAWLPLKEWPCRVDVGGHRVYRMTADDYGWTHLGVRRRGEASGYGLDTPAWAGVIVYIMPPDPEREKPAANDLQWRLIGEIAHRDYKWARLEDPKITGVPATKAKRPKAAVPAKVDGTVIYVTQDSNGNWMTTIKSKTKPAWRPADHPQVRVEAVLR